MPEKTIRKINVINIESSDPITHLYHFTQLLPSISSASFYISNWHKSVLVINDPVVPHLIHNLCVPSL